MKKLIPIAIAVLGILVIALIVSSRPKSPRFGLDIRTGPDHPITLDIAAIEERLENLPPDSPEAQALREVLYYTETGKNTVLAHDTDGDTPASGEQALQQWVGVIDTFRTALPPSVASSDEGEDDPVYPEVTEADRRIARALFKALPEEQQREETHHAMNLLPDETVSLMYDILFDKTQDEDVIVIIFCDLLNRDESIKNPVLEEIAKDKEHPMFTEAARILDITRDDDE